jgi:hypothetical protein
MWRRSSKKVMSVESSVGTKLFQKNWRGSNESIGSQRMDPPIFQTVSTARRAGLLNQNRKDGTSTEAPRVFSHPPRTFQAGPPDPLPTSLKL